MFTHGIDRNRQAVRYGTMLDGTFERKKDESLQVGACCPVAVLVWRLAFWSVVSQQREEEMHGMQKQRSSAMPSTATSKAEHSIFVRTSTVRSIFLFSSTIMSLSFRKY